MLPGLQGRPTASWVTQTLGRDMTDNSKRPFYAEYAWAFDLLIDRPVRKECAAIAAWLIARGVLPGADLLDAGCGTGRYAAELARRGYVVQGIDQSAELIDVATRSTRGRVPVSFAVGDIRTLPASRYDAILCRGVLNDIVDDEGREAVLATFAGALRVPGVLILDVREWETSAARKALEPVFKKSVDTNRGKLTFTSVTELDRENRCLVLSERHTLVEDCQERSSDYQFVMRCWTPSELEISLMRNGFSPVAYFGAYDPTVHLGATDRLVAVAQCSRAAG
jgi:SAM-dependent methyltransferase